MVRVAPADACSLSVAAAQLAGLSCSDGLSLIGLKFHLYLCT